jgi:hypothetical protein
VVIATVFLTIIGMTAGFMLGERHRRKAATNPVADRTTTQPGPTLPPATDGKLCPEQTRRTAERLGFSSNLRQVMKIETANATTVWICQDDTGAYYYQGKTGGAEQPLVEGTNGLFLDKVRHGEDREEYTAVADNGNRFVVNRKQLEIHFAAGKPTQIYPVVASE